MPRKRWQRVFNLLAVLVTRLRKLALNPRAPPEAETETIRRIRRIYFIHPRGNISAVQHEISFCVSHLWFAECDGLFNRRRLELLLQGLKFRRDRRFHLEHRGFNVCHHSISCHCQVSFVLIIFDRKIGVEDWL